MYALACFALVMVLGPDVARQAAARRPRTLGSCTPLGVPLIAASLSYVALAGFDRAMLVGAEGAAVAGRYAAAYLVAEGAVSIPALCSALQRLYVGRRGLPGPGFGSGATTHASVPAMASSSRQPRSSWSLRSKAGPSSRRSAAPSTQSRTWCRRCSRSVSSRREPAAGVHRVPAGARFSRPRPGVPTRHRGGRPAYGGARAHCGYRRRGGRDAGSYVAFYLLVRFMSPERALTSYPREHLAVAMLATGAVVAVGLLVSPVMAFGVGGLVWTAAVILTLRR